MAIFHLSANVISRSGGRSVVAAAAYRHAASMKHDREERTFTYSSKHDVTHTEIAIPGNSPEWVHELLDGKSADRGSEALWNKVEAFETRKDAELAREIIVALPKEMSLQDNIDTVREFVEIFTARGQIADWAFHNLEGNPHAHIMLTTRPLTPDGFGKKKIPKLDEKGEIIRSGEGEKSRIVYRRFAGDKAELHSWRAAWAQLVNRRLAERGIDERIDHRSHADRGLDITPTKHRGVQANGMFHKGVESDRIAEERRIADENYAFVMQRPEVIFEGITDNKSVFTADDVARSLHTYIQDPGRYQNLLARLLQSDELVPLALPVVDPKTNETLVKGRFTTRSMIEIEQKLIADAKRLRAGAGFSVQPRQLQNAISVTQKEGGFTLSDQQVAALEGMTRAERLASLVGLAGTGKSTLLKAGRMAWEAEGYRVRGFALAGKAADNLTEASGIKSITLASLEAQQREGKAGFGSKDILVVDEAGLVGSQQLARFMRSAEASGAKVVLVGDTDQLQPISAGAAFRAILERTGYSEVNEIIRQDDDWQRQASLDLARGNIKKALQIYESNFCVMGSGTQDNAIKALALDFGIHHRGGDEVVALANSNQMVGRLNDAIRHDLKAHNALGIEEEFATSRGLRSFAPGDKIVFLQNDKLLGGEGGVKNGQLATVVQSAPNALTVKLQNGREIAFGSMRYDHVDHGFALTIFKSQGVTVDHVHVLAQRSMTRNLAYVAMTRHKKSAQLYYGQASFNRDVFEGGIVEALSRPDDTATTLDYEARAEYHEAVIYGDRRGLDSAKAVLGGLKKRIKRRAATLKKLTDRFAKHEIDQPRKSDLGSWWVPPIHEYERSIEAVANDVVLGSDIYHEQQEKAFHLMEKVYADPQKAFEALVDLVHDPRIGSQDLRHQFETNPEVFGDLAGRKGAVVSGKDRRSRKSAEGHIDDLRRSVMDWSRSVRVMTERAVGDEQERRERRSIGLPALSDKDIAWLRKTDSVSPAEMKDMAANGGAPLKRLEALNKAIESRFGGINKFLNQDATRYSRADRAAKAVLERHKSLLLMSQRVSRKIAELRAERKPPSRTL